MQKLRVTVWNENIHEKTLPISEIYPKGIHGAISEMLDKYNLYDIKTATLFDPENGLSDEVLNNTDVLIWWGHIAHDKVSDKVAENVKNRVLGGMGFIVLHSGRSSKPFKLLMGTSCKSNWRENDEKEIISVINPNHPIAEGIPECIEIENDETYSETFDIPTPDETVFTSRFSGGDVFRSGCCFKRGLGKIFLFSPGHEEYPIYYREDIIRIIKNAIEWSNPKK